MINKSVTDDKYRDLLEWACNLETGPWVAGGSVRKVWYGKPWLNQDIDFFFHDQTQYDSITRALPELGIGIKIYHTSKNAVSYRVELRSGEIVKIQTICKRFYNDLDELLRDFDFNITCFATDGETMVAVPEALDDIKRNRIRVNPAYNGDIIPARVIKYAAYGFDPEPEIFANTIKEFAKGGLREIEY